jgi:hypothetical protein
MYHSALTTAQSNVLAEIPSPGDSIERMFPMFDGMVIFNR